MLDDSFRRSGIRLSRSRCPSLLLACRCSRLAAMPDNGGPGGWFHTESGCGPGSPLPAPPRRSFGFAAASSPRRTEQEDVLRVLGRVLEWTVLNAACCLLSPPIATGEADMLGGRLRAPIADTIRQASKCRWYARPSRHRGDHHPKTARRVQQKLGLRRCSTVSPRGCCHHRRVRRAPRSPSR